MPFRDGQQNTIVASTLGSVGRAHCRASRSRRAYEFCDRVQLAERWRFGRVLDAFWICLHCISGYVQLAGLHLARLNPTGVLQPSCIVFFHFLCGMFIIRSEPNSDFEMTEQICLVSLRSICYPNFSYTSSFSHIWSRDRPIIFSIDSSSTPSAFWCS